VLTLGTGGVSIFAVQFARAAGAPVIAASSSDEKLARLKDLGADHLINNKSDPKWGRSAAAWAAGQRQRSCACLGRLRTTVFWRALRNFSEILPLQLY
jgi:NADPH:quinone reductase-like Zn-dependent oxidoreductase